MKRQRTRADELDAFIDAIPRTGQPAIDAETTRAAEALRALAEATSPRAEFVSDLEERLLGTGQERGRVLPFGAARGAAPPPPPLLTTARAAGGRTGPRAPGRIANRGVRARLVTGANRVASVAAVAVLLAVLAGALALVLPTMQRGGGGSSGGSGTLPMATPAPPTPPAGLPQELQELYQVDASAYPDVVARVNGQPISGKALAQRVYIVQNSRTPGLDKTDPVRTALNQLIGEAVLTQVAPAHGVSVSEDEARAFAQSQRRMAEQAQDHDKEALAALAASLGVSPEEYFTDPRVIETYRQGMILGRMRGQVLETLPAERRGDPAAQQAAIADFVARSGARVEVLIDLRPTPQPSRDPLPAGQPTPAAQATPDADLVAKFRAVQDTTDFPLAIPTDTTGFTLGYVERAGAATAPFVESVLVEQREGRGKLLFSQSATGFGAVPPLEGVTTPPSSVQVQGVTATLELGRGRDGTARVRLAWQQDGISYLLTGYGIAPERIIGIANSLQRLP